MIMNTLIIYAYTAVYGNLSREITPDSSLRMAQDILADFNETGCAIPSVDKYFAYIECWIEGDEQWAAYRRFRRNYFKWARRRGFC